MSEQEEIREIIEYAFVAYQCETDHVVVWEARKARCDKVRAWLDSLDTQPQVPDDVVHLIDVMVQDHLSHQEWTKDTYWDNIDTGQIQKWLDSLPQAE